MKRGNSSNCVHWLYALLTGTFTSTVLVTWVVMSLLLARGHQHLVGAACLLLCRPGRSSPKRRDGPSGPALFRHRPLSQGLRGCQVGPRKLSSRLAANLL